MRLKSLHPGVTREEVLDRMSFVPEMPEAHVETEPPGPRALHLIRNVIDPQHVLLRV